MRRGVRLVSVHKLYLLSRILIELIKLDMLLENRDVDFDYVNKRIEKIKESFENFKKF